MKFILFVICLNFFILFPVVKTSLYAHDSGKINNSMALPGSLTIKPGETKKLSGKWFFKTDDSPEYKNKDISLEGWDLINNNIPWQEYPQFSNYTGIAWYRMNFFLSQESDDLALFIPIHSRAAQFYLNEKLLYETRPFSKNGETPKIVGKPDFVQIPRNFLIPGENILAIRTGELDYSSGFMEDIVIGDKLILKKKWIQYILWAFIPAAINLFVAFYFLLYYFNKNKESYCLTFSVLSFSLGIWILGYRGFILWLFDYQVAYIFATYCGSIIFSISLLYFLHSFLKIKKTIITRIFEIIYTALLLFAGFEFLTSGDIELFVKYFFVNFMIINGLLFMYGVFLCVKGLKEKKPFARRILLGMASFALLFFISFFKFVNILNTEPLIIEGFFIMIIIFATVLASRFSQIHNDLEKAHEELLVLDRMKDDFLATTSHELRTPLHGIIGLSDAMLINTEKPVPECHRENLMLITHSAKRLNSLVNDILDFSKLKAGKVDLLLQEINLYDLIPTIVSLAGGLVEQKDLVLRYKMADDIPLISADHYRIEQVLLNLIGNAIKYSEKGEILVSVSLSKNRVLVSVKDEGCGIDKKNINLIWDPYAQLEEADTRKQGGSGLGLTVTKYLVEIHGGSVWVKSTPGTGTTFYFTLPLDQPAGKPGIRRKDRGRGAISSQIDLLSLSENMEQRANLNEIILPKNIDSGSLKEKPERARILIVDDDPINIRVLDSILTNEGYSIIPALSGPEALLKISKEQPNLVLLDLMLPGMSGYDVALEIKKTYRDIFIPIIMITAKNQLEDMVKAFIFGGNDYLEKPFKTRELLIRVENMLVIKQMMDMSKEVESQLSREREKLGNKLLDHTKRLQSAVQKVRRWENIITQDLQLSKTFLDRLMSVSIFSQNIQCAVHYEPLLEIGGDLYDIYEYEPGKLRLFLADATGHGINAALSSITIITEYNLVKSTLGSPGEILKHLNSKFCSELSKYRLVFTCIVVDIDINRNSLSIARAGHTKAYRISPSSGVKEIMPAGIIIGFKDDIDFEELNDEFTPGSSIFLYTDGLYERYEKLIEVARSLGNDLSSFTTIGQALAEFSGSGSLEDMLEKLHGLYCPKSRNDSGVYDLDDDITMIALRYLP